MKKAFTLIELLVVISIIAMLMSILMPALGKAKDIAKDVICKSNLHQWSIVYATYVSENDDKFYTAWYSSSVGHQWVYLLKDQFQTYDVAMCPNASKVPQVTGADIVYAANNDGAWATGPDDLRYGETYGSYGINMWVGNPGTLPTAILNSPFWKDNKHKYWKQSSVSGANNVPLFRGAIWMGGAPKDTHVPPEWEDFTYADTYAQAWGAMSRFVVTRHKGENENTLFVDHSVRSVGAKELWTLKWHKDFNTRNSFTLAGGVQPGDWPDWMKGFKDY